MIYKKSIYFLILLFFTGYLFSQSAHIKRIELLNDSATYRSDQQYIFKNKIKKTYFYYTSDDETFEVRVYPAFQHSVIGLVPSRDYEIVDSMIHINNYLRFKIRFKNITKSELLRFTFRTTSDSLKSFEEFPLQPVTNTSVWITPGDDQLFIGEEKTFEVYSNNIQNLNVSNEWVNNEELDYRFTVENEKVFLHLIPKKTGRISLSATVHVHKPWLNSSTGKLNYQLEPLTHVFNVKASRLQFLSLDKSELTLSEDTKLNGIEIQIENSRLFEMQKTYRIEAQEDAGGALIAELFTKQRLVNNRILCLIRPYNYHRNSDGYLYIKDGDTPRFITNVSITPATQIEKISILKEGSEWVASNTVHPGEIADIKLTGQGLHKARFTFEDLIDITNDTLIKSEKELVFKLKVPIDISRKKLNIYNYSTPTGQSLKVEEFQRPRELDFVYVNYGDFARRLSGIKEPILYDNVIKDLIISFNPDKIDEDKLYGKQYLNMKFQITDKNNRLIEIKTLDDIVICPSEESPRGNYYNLKNCTTDNISLNKEIRKPTYSLDEWSRINLVISHDKSKYGGEGYEKEIDIILKRSYSFDVEVSFPAGLLTIYPTDTTHDLKNLSGISMAMIAQFSFYHPDKINTYRPYKIGAGFLALNAFNLSRGMDLSLVVLGSVYPTTKDTKLSFPLYVGAGFSLTNDEAKTAADRFFFLIGPGIRVRF